jgi:hypothetical protein
MTVTLRIVGATQRKVAATPHGKVHGTNLQVDLNPTRNSRKKGKRRKTKKKRRIRKKRKIKKINTSPRSTRRTRSPRERTKTFLIADHPRHHQVKPLIKIDMDCMELLGTSTIFKSRGMYVAMCTVRRY